MLILKTLTRRIALPVVLFLAWTPAAHAWSWPLQGPVLQPFTYDEAHPYLSGQHRGIDIGAAAAGDTVLAPAAGSVSFAGTVPTNGASVTIETADGYSVTLTHLGSLLVAKGAAVVEGDAVGTVGPSGTPEVDVPYVHLGIRLEADPNGYVDPLGLLPAPADGPPADDPPADSAAPVQQPGASGGSAASPPAAAPAPPAPVSTPVATTRGSTAVSRRSRPAHHTTQRAQEPPVETAQQPASRPARARQRGQHLVRTPHRRPRAAPVAEPSARREPTGLDAGHEPQRSVPVPRVLPGGHGVSPVALLCNGAAAVVALTAAFFAARRRRAPVAAAEVVPLPRPVLDRGERRAA